MYHKRMEKFPDDFLFGAGTSSFQVEGGVNEGGRGIAVHDLKKPKKGITDFSVASDHYHRYEEDIELMKELGLNSYRFSISWVRILPDGKTINEEGLAFYDRLIQKLIDSGIEPVVTIYHFEYPKALVNKYKGWLSRESIDDYVNFAKILFSSYGDRVRYWLTINEQDHLLKIPERIGFPEEMTGLEYERNAQLANYNMCIAGARVTKLCHEMIPGAKIAPIINPMPAIPASNIPDDLIASMEFNELSAYYMLDLNCRGKYSPVYRKYLEDRDILPDINDEDMKLMRDNPPDFIAINYYMNQTVAASNNKEINLRGREVFVPEEAGIYKIVENEHVPQTDWGWNICPEGLKIAIMEIYNRYELPMLITENGLGAYDRPENGEIHDNYRIDYISRHLSQIKDCISMGFPVFGYSAWSFIDLVSGREGMDKRYGFVYINRDNDDLKDWSRIKKDSYYWYKKIIAERGQDL